MMISIVAKLISRCGDNEIMISRLANMIKRGGDDNDMISRVAKMIRRGVFFLSTGVMISRVAKKLGPR